MVRMVQTAQFSQLIWLNAVAQVVVGLMQTAQREVQNAGRGYPASLRLDGGEIGSLHNKHDTPGGEKEGANNPLITAEVQSDAHSR